MTVTDFTTATRITPVLVAPPDLAANIAAAQHAGDLAYALRQWAGLTNTACADAYHETFTRVMFERSTPMPCACGHCFWLNFERHQNGAEVTK